ASNAVPGVQNYYTNEKILELLGYSVANVGEKVTELAVDRAEELLLNPFLAPLNRYIRKTFGFDDFRFRANVAKSFAHQRWDPNLPPIMTSRYYSNKKLSDLFLTPELSLGKYILPDLYFMYRGQLVRLIDENQDIMGLNHVIGFEYQMKNQLFIELQYDYDYYRYLDRGDARLLLRHKFHLNSLKKDN
ncbi:unnamed protein product, partial [marine sediment metagenome]